MEPRVFEIFAPHGTVHEIATEGARVKGPRLSAGERITTIAKDDVRKCDHVLLVRPKNESWRFPTTLEGCATRDELDACSIEAAYFYRVSASDSQEA